MREIKKIKEKVDELENVLKDRDLFKGMVIQKELLYMIDKLSIKNEDEVDENLFLLWKRGVSRQVNYIYDRNPKYIFVKDIYKDIYTYMRNVYGIVWEQEEKEWYENHVDRPTTLDIIYENKTYKSIFDSILHDKYHEVTKKHPEVLSIDEIIGPLIKTNDDLDTKIILLKKIFTSMETAYKVDWNRYIKRYLKENNILKNNSDLLYCNKKLMEYFRDIVKRMSKVNCI